MEIFTTDHKVFKKKYDTGKPQLLFTTLSGDLYTPVSTLLKFKKEKYSFLFESVEKGNNKGRYSFLGLKPDLIWECKDNKCVIKNIKEKITLNNNSKSPLDSLKKLFKDNKFKIPENLPPMSAGLFGYLGYDMIQYFEKLDFKNIDSLKLPDSIFIRPTIMLVFDNVSDKLYIVRTVWPNSIEASKVLLSAKKEITQILKKIQIPLKLKNISHKKAYSNNQLLFKDVSSNIDYTEFKKMVNKAKEYIFSGEIFQVVLSRCFKKKISTSPISIYRALRYLNPSPYLFYINLDKFCIIGSSPEILVRLSNKIVTIRPIAGTRKRGQSHKEDLKLKDELLNDPKEKSEHLMLLDLGRNDVSRVTKPGSVNITDKMIVEYFSHVMHIVSNVNGVIKDNLDNVDALFAGFPAGTVSGAPKIRAMEIIEELEKNKRNIYAGAIGYLSANGNLDSCIALRTAVIKDNNIYIQSGAGIVADSRSKSEYKETENKALALLEAVVYSKNFDI